MDLRLFIGLVKEQAPPHLRDQAHLRAAILDIAEERNRIDVKFIPEILARAERLYSQEIMLTPTASGSIASEFLAGKLAPVVEALREEGFGSKSAPFDTKADAAQWIEKASEADLRTWREAGAQRQSAREEIERLAGENRIEITYENTLLAYQRPNQDHVRHVPTVPSTYLYKLARETKRIAKYTGLPEDAFTVHILTGLRPELFRVRIKDQERMLALPDGEQVLSRWADIQFFARDLRDKDLRKIYGAIRESLGVEGKHPFESEDLQFWQFVRDRGPIPDKGKMKFWEDALRPWRQAHPETGINTRDSMKRKFTRLDERLKVEWRNERPGKSP